MTKYITQLSLLFIAISALVSCGCVNAMVKHWPGGGLGEVTCDAHYGEGKYAVYPGNNFAMHMIPFTEGAFKLKGKTGITSAVMPHYTIPFPFNQNPKYKENVDNGDSKYILQDLLRDKYNYDGVVCTDWLFTGDETTVDVFLTGKSWGVEGLSIAERHYKVLMAGVDQFGGNNEKGPVIEVSNMAVKEHGEDFMRAHFEQLSVRLLKNIFRIGFFENPYVNVDETKAIVGKPEFMKAGYDAQLKSVVMLKNKANALPLKKNKPVYIPKKFTPAERNFLGMEIPEKLGYPVSIEIVKKYFNITENPDEADNALVFVNSPNSGISFNSVNTKKGGNVYVPISLQYGEYTAKEAHETCIAGGDPQEKFTNRSYKNKKNKAVNISDLGTINDTFKNMKGKPVIVSINMNNPMVFAEFEKNTNALLVHFSVQDQALLDILTVVSEPIAFANACQYGNRRITI